MGELLEKAIREKMLQDIDGTAFYIHRHRNGQKTDELAHSVKNLIAEYNLSVSEAKGFLEHMKLVIDSGAYLPQEK
ncbi:MAG: hypothetical protein HFH72_09045 [Lachnospiraceae bacterium]|nr:hypothetical protein [Lachnospiraceae bacterium]